MDSNPSTVLITGATSVIGRTLVKRFAARGWNVIGTVRNLDDNRDFEQEMGITLFQLDLTDDESMLSFQRQVVQHGRKIDVLINNAGRILSGPFEGLDDSMLMDVMRVNYFGPIRLIRMLLPDFKKRRNGVIVNVSSIAGLVSFPMFSGYHASKWALEGFTESLYHELSTFSIRVKLVEPGGVSSREYDSDVQVAGTDLEEYRDVLSTVHGSSWYPSFSDADAVAEVVMDAIDDESDRLRYFIGDDCGVFLRERNYTYEDQKYLRVVSDLINKELNTNSGI